MKKLLRTTQMLQEKLGVTTRETKYDQEFTELESVFNSSSQSLIVFCDKVTEIMNPNPPSSWKVKMITNVATGNKNNNATLPKYPQIEEALAAELQKYSNSCIETNFGKAASEIAEYFTAISDMKDNLESKLRGSVIDKINDLKESKIKMIQNMRKRLGKKRLDLDSIKQKKSATNNELMLAQEAYDVTKIEVINAYNNFISNGEVEHIEMFSLYAEIMHNFYNECSILTRDTLLSIKNHETNSANAPKVEAKTYVPTSFNSLSDSDGIKGSVNKVEPKSRSTFNIGIVDDVSEMSIISEPPANKNRSFKMAEAIYDFDGDDAVGELSFKKGDKIRILSSIDENWSEGMVNKVKGLVPNTYINIV